MMTDELFSQGHEIYSKDKKPLLPRRETRESMISVKLLSRVHEVDTQTLAEIHDAFYPVVYRYVRFRIDDETAAEDITGEVFMRLLDALKGHRGPTQNLRGWLLGTAAHLVVDHLRQQYSRPVKSLEELEIPVDHDPEEAASVSWQRRQVRQAFDQLTPEQQHVLALRFSGDYSLDETAHLMGKTIGAIKTLQFRALASLRRLLDVSVQQ